jgi:pentatricopeptide repeat protein
MWFLYSISLGVCSHALQATQSAIVKACLDCGQLEAARELYAEMRAQGLVPALPAFNTLINAHGAASRLGTPPASSIAA